MADRRAWIRAKKLALKRRISLKLKGEFNPYPKAPAGSELAPSDLSARLLAEAPLKLSHRKNHSLSSADWQDQARRKLAELAGYGRAELPAVEIHRQEFDDIPGYTRMEFILRDEFCGDLPVTIINRRGDGTADKPVMICLQGTNSGFHLSWGAERMPADPIKVAGGGDYAIQAADRGYLAVCLEQSCFGLRRENKLNRISSDPCIDAANHFLLFGRTLLGQRCSDVSAVVSWLENGRHDLPANRADIRLMGQSTGGTVALFTSALDIRIRATMATGCLGLMGETILQRGDPAGQNVLPGIMSWMELDDVVALSAPRPFLSVSGTRDHIWPAAAGARVVEMARPVFEQFGAGKRIEFVAVEGPHKFYPEESWQAFDRLLSAD